MSFAPIVLGPRCGCSPLEFCAECNPREAYRMLVEMVMSNFHVSGRLNEHQLHEVSRRLHELPDVEPEAARAWIEGDRTRAMEVALEVLRDEGHRR